MKTTYDSISWGQEAIFDSDEDAKNYVIAEPNVVIAITGTKQIYVPILSFNSVKEVIKARALIRSEAQKFGCIHLVEISECGSRLKKGFLASTIEV